MSENTKTGHVVWEGQGLTFRGIGGSGYQIRFDSPASPNGGSPMELVALASAGCTASDVISILQKKQQKVTEFEVNIVGIRAVDHPKVFTQIDLEYVVTGRGIDPKAVERAIELSLTKYCSVNLMLEKAVKAEPKNAAFLDSLAWVLFKQNEAQERSSTRCNRWRWTSPPGRGGGDTEKDAEYLADKVLNLRVFPDEAGQMNRSVLDVSGGLLVVSQFTLLGDARRGRRPSYDEASPPEEADRLYQYFVSRLRPSGLEVATGVFRAMMDVALVNEGPVTILLDRRKTF